MSTSEFDPARLTAPAPSAANLPAGWPDADQLTCLANQLLAATRPPAQGGHQAAPAVATVGGFRVPGGQGGSAPAPAQAEQPFGAGLPLSDPAPAGFGLPSLAQLQTLLAAGTPGGAESPAHNATHNTQHLPQATHATPATPASDNARSPHAAHLAGGPHAGAQPTAPRGTAPHAVSRNTGGNVPPHATAPATSTPHQSTFQGYPAPVEQAHAPGAIPASHGSDLQRSGAPAAGYGLPDEAQLQALLQPAQFGYGSTPQPALGFGAPGAPGASDASASPFYFLSPQASRPVLATPQGPGAAPPSAPGPFGAPGATVLHRGFDNTASRAGSGLGGHVAHHQYGSGGAPFDVERIRQDFPILRERVNGRQLVWLDNAATTHKPHCVIDRLRHFYAHENSNIHRAAHELAARATDAYEGAREKVRGFLNAASPNEIVFVRGATEAINLVAQSWGRQHIGKDDEIVISWLEHHANIVPWQQLCAETGARLRVAAVDDDGQILLDDYARLLGPRTRLVAFTQVSNALGTITPAKQMVEMAHAVGARVLVDGAQAVSHLRADVQYLNCDWYVFSGHKVFGPTGIGVLYGKEALLNATQPWQGGGNMIRDVRFEHTEYHLAPGRFEAGTGNIADAVGLGAAIDYVNAIGIDNINRYEHQLLVYATGLLRGIPGLRLIGTAADKASVLSFVLDGYKTEDVGAALSREGIAVRSGHHCAQPILRRFGVESSVRPSLAFYNNRADVDALATAVRRLKTGHAGSFTAVPR